MSLPSGIPANQDLVRLAAYDQYYNHLRETTFVIVVNDPALPFGIRAEDGKGVVFAQRPLSVKAQYQIMVRARSYEDAQRRDIQYQTTFMIYISVSRYPY